MAEPLDFLPDGDTVGLVAEPQDGQQHDLFELPEMLTARHMFCIVGLYGAERKSVAVLATP